MLQRVEVITPGVGHTAGVRKVVFVHLFDVRGVAAEEIGIRLAGLINLICLTHFSLNSVSLEETLAG
jgi:hypothetical protein